MLKLWNSNMKSQVSSRRFFMYCPCLYGLKASPVRLRIKKTVRTSNFCQQLTNKSVTPLMKPHLVRPDAGSDVEVWSVRGPVLRCTMEPPVEVCLGLSEGSYCASASGDSQACWASVLWMVDLLQGHSAPQSHPEWNPRAQDHLQGKQTSGTERGWSLHHTIKVM